MACRTTPRPSPSPSNQSTCCGPNLANLATVDTTSIKGGFLVGLGSANQRRLKVILRARGGDLEGKGGGEKREKGKGKKKRVQQQLKMRQRVHCKNWHQHSTRGGSSGGKWCKTEEASNLRVQRMAALDDGHRWLRQRGSRRQSLAPPRCSAWPRAGTRSC